MAAVRAASTPLRPSAWRSRLAQRVHAALGPEAQSVAVASFLFDRAEQQTFALWPTAGAHDPIEVWARRAVPGFARGYPWRELRARHGTVYPARLAMPAAAVDEMLMAIGQHGASGVVVALMISSDPRDEERLVGYIPVQTFVPEAGFIARHAASLAMVADAAAHTVSASFAMAYEMLGKEGHDALVRLTERERRVVELAAQGLSDLNIAARLCLSETTVGSHIHRAFRKLGVHTRVELTRLLQTTTL